jgi:hypothetical protein
VNNQQREDEKGNSDTNVKLKNREFRSLIPNISDFSLDERRTRSGRMIKQTNKYGMPNPEDFDGGDDDETSNIVSSTQHAYAVLNHDEPTTYDEAMRSDERANWKEAMDSEMNAMHENKSWSLVERQPDMNVIGSKWVYKIKRKGDGTVERFKARLVARGFSQIEGVDYDETFAPVMRYKTLRIILAIANELNYEVRQMDVTNAFLNASVCNDIFMEQPVGYITGDKKYVCKLNKAVYGIKQAPNLWNQEIDHFMKQHGFNACKSDVCQYTYRCVSGRIITVGIFVDDIVISYHPEDEREWITCRDKLMNKYKVKDNGDISYILGMVITRDRKQRTLKISQTKYIEKVLERYGMSRVTPAPTPEVSGTKLTMAMSPTNDEQKKDMKNIPYREAVGSLLYAAIGTRPDISHAVNECARYVSNPGSAHWIAIKRIMRYLAGTIDMGLIYNGLSNNELNGNIKQNNILTIDTYVDADWAGDKDDRKSTTGYLTKMNGNTITWSSKKQRTVALSSAEAEYMAIASGAQECKWMKQLLSELGYDTVVHIYTDNQAAQSIGKNDIYHDRTKHIDIRYHFVRHDIKEQIYDLIWVPTRYQLADIFTKGLNHVHYSYLSNLVMNAYQP